MDRFIELPYGAPGEGFMISYLVTYLQESRKNYIIQGQVNCSLADHPKPNSLDVWFRQHFTSRQDTKQATNALLQEILKTGLFKEGLFTCPDSGRKCKGIELIKRPRTRVSDHHGSISRVSDIRPS